MATLVSAHEFVGPRQRLTFDIPENGERFVEEESDAHVRTYRTTQESTDVTGFRYQRCGGGRRVIKKSGGI